VIKSAENFKLVTITKSHQENFLSKLFEFGIKTQEVESCQHKGRLPIQHIFCIQHSPTYLNFLTRRHLALDWLLYSFFKGGAIFGRNHHNKFINRSGLLKQNERPLGRPLTDSERRN
jgi:hypothetical protein